MKIFLCCLLLPAVVTVVEMTPIKDQRENVLSFLNDALDMTPTEKTLPGDFTAKENPTKPPARPQKNSAESDISKVIPAANSADITDVSEPRSRESDYSREFTGLSEKNLAGESREDDDYWSLKTRTQLTGSNNVKRKDVDAAVVQHSIDMKGALRDLNSQETVIPPVMGRDQTTPETRDVVDTDNMKANKMASRQHPGHGSAEQSGTHRALPVDTDRASRELIDLNSEEGVLVDGQEAGYVSRKEAAIRASGVQVIKNASRDIYFQSNEAPERDQAQGRVEGLNGIDPGQSREMQDLDSFEAVKARPAAGGNSRDRDYDETQECISAERPPAVPSRGHGQ